VRVRKALRTAGRLMVIQAPPVPSTYPSWVL
jgi:hypothetical protein